MFSSNVQKEQKMYKFDKTMEHFDDFRRLQVLCGSRLKESLVGPPGSEMRSVDDMSGCLIHVFNGCQLSFILLTF